MAEDVKIRFSGDTAEVKAALRELKGEFDSVGKSASAAFEKANQSAADLAAEVQRQNKAMAGATGSGHLDAAEDARKHIDALQAELAALGKNRQERELLDAKRAGFAVQDQQEIARIGAKIDAYHRQEQAAKDLAKTADKAALLVEKQNLQEAVAADALVAKIKQMAAEHGKSATEILKMRAAQLGVTEAVGAEIAVLETVAGATHKFSLANAGIVNEIGVLGRELASGNLSRLPGSMSVMASRAGVLQTVFSGAGLAVAGFVGILATLAVGFIKGAEDSFKLQQSIALTGNAAGVTEGQYNAMALGIAKATETHVGSARTILGSLIATGQFSGKALESTAAAAASFSKASGQSADEVVKDFAKMADGAFRWAQEHNKQYHFLTAAQLEYVRRLEEQGKSEEAYIVISNAVIEHNGQHAQSVGTLITIYRRFGDNIDFIKEKLLSIGRDTTLEEKLAAVEQRLNARAGRGGVQVETGAERARDERLAAQLRTQIADATAKSSSDAARARGETALTEFNDFTEKYRTRAETAAKEIAEVNARFNKAISLNPNLDPASSKFDAAGYDKLLKERDASIAAINEKHHAAKGPKDDPTQALLAGTLKSLEDEIAAEKTLLSSRNKMFDLYLGENLVSIRAYYDGRKNAADLAHTAELAGFDKEIAALQANKANPSTSKVQQAEDEKRIIALIDQKRAAQQAAAEEGTVAALKEQQAYQDLADKLEQVKIRLLELEGSSVGATQEKLLLQYRALIKQLEAESDKAELEIVKRLINAEVAQSQLSKIKTDFDRTAGQLSGLQQDLANAVTLGTENQFGADQKFQAARARALVDLRAQIDLQRTLYATMSGEQAAKALDELNAMERKYNDIATAKSKFSTDIENAGSNALSNFLTDLGNRATTASEKVTALALNFAKSMAQMAADALSRQAIMAGMNALGFGDSGNGAIKITQAAAAGTAQAAPLITASSALSAAGGVVITAAAAISAAAAQLAAAATVAAAAQGASIAGGVAHAGGIIGSLSTTRYNLNPALWATAPRYHGGGVIGPGERAIIAKDGEEMLTENDPRHRNNGGLNQGAAITVRNINVFDSSMIHDAMASPGGEKVVLNAIARNKNAIKQSLS